MLLLALFLICVCAQEEPFPFGTILGESHGVLAYSNGGGKFPDGADSTNYIGFHMTGTRWQCVEYARRFLILTSNITFASIPNAYDIWALSHWEQLYEATETHIPIVRYENGNSTIAPTVGALLIWPRGPAIGDAGHVAVITGVESESVRITEENYDDTVMWYGARQWSRTLPLEKSPAGIYTIISPEPVYGSMSTWFHHLHMCCPVHVRSVSALALSDAVVVPWDVLEVALDLVAPPLWRFSTDDVPDTSGTRSFLREFAGDPSACIREDGRLLTNLSQGDRLTWMSPSLYERDFCVASCKIQWDGSRFAHSFMAVREEEVLHPNRKRLQMAEIGIPQEEGIGRLILTATTFSLERQTASGTDDIIFEHGWDLTPGERVFLCVYTYEEYFEVRLL